MSHDDSSPQVGGETQSVDHSAPEEAAPHQVEDLATDPISSSWRTINAPWGTPGNHLTGPIPRIRRRPDGSLTHGEES